MGKIDVGEMRRELDAQVRTLLELGVQPTHWDGHQHKHLYPPFFIAAMKVAKKYNITRMRTHNRYLVLDNNDTRRYQVAVYYLKHPVRICTRLYGRLSTCFARCKGFKTADRLITLGYADRDDEYLVKTWITLVNHLPLGVNEIVCHPGYPDDILRQNATYVDQRKEELSVLTSGALKEALHKSRVQLISFYEL
jgi:hypothetical protein